MSDEHEYPEMHTVLVDEQSQDMRLQLGITAERCKQIEKMVMHSIVDAHGSPVTHASSTWKGLVHPNEFFLACWVLAMQTIGGGGARPMFALVVPPPGGE